MNEALLHALTCQQLLEREPLSTCQAYCARQRIVPPLTAQPGSGRESELQYQQAAAKMSDYGWWLKQLKLRDARELRRQQRAAALRRARHPARPGHQAHQSNQANQAHHNQGSKP